MKFELLGPLRVAEDGGEPLSGPLALGSWTRPDVGADLHGLEGALSGETGVHQRPVAGSTRAAIIDGLAAYRRPNGSYRLSNEYR